MAIETFPCRSCGAAVDPRSEACTHCASPFLLVPCEGCGRPLALGAPSCPECQAVGPRTLPSVATRHECPACDGFLHRPQAGQVGLEFCPGCGGTWMEPETFIEFAMEAAKPEGRRFPERRGTRASQANAAFYRACPECRRSMNRRQFAQGAKVVLDHCREHGLWLDSGEWQRVAAFLREGGMQLQGLPLESYLRQQFARLDAQALRALGKALAQGVRSSRSATPEFGLDHGWLVVDLLSSAVDSAIDSWD